MDGTVSADGGGGKRERKISELKIKAGYTIKERNKKELLSFIVLLCLFLLGSLSPVPFLLRSNLVGVILCPLPFIGSARFQCFIGHRLYALLHLMC